MDLKSLNVAPEQTPVTNTESQFRLSIPPKTDVFASPALGYHFSAPILYQQISTQSFQTARTTISLPFEPSSTQHDNERTLQFDQAGLIFVLPHPSLPQPTLENPGSKSNSETGIHPKWIKAGIEVWEGKAWGSIVARDSWSDWSLFELPLAPPEASLGTIKGREAVVITLEADRVGDALMIYLVEEGKARKPVRKVPWWFMKGETEDICWVGIYGARPDPYHEATCNLEVRFSGFVVDTK